MRTERSGQALMELAVGLFTLALVASALVAFASFIVRTLEFQNGARVGRHSEVRVEIDGPAATHVFGTGSIRVREKVRMPSTIIR